MPPANAGRRLEGNTGKRRPACSPCWGQHTAKASPQIAMPILPAQNVEEKRKRVRRNEGGEVNKETVW